ncbi:MAG: radical SAM protein [Lentisphaerae bacterium]|nr:radical SAM protein [Lentisphaerota bacterium]
MHRYGVLAWRFAALRPRPGQVLNLLTYAACLTTGRFPRRLPYTPITFGAHVTSRCNLKCVFCNNPGVNRDPRGQSDMTLEEFAALLVHPNWRHAFRVSFTGGEPLLHPDVFTFAKLARKHKKLTYMATNGLLIGERLDEFRTSPLDTIHLSLYAQHLDKQVDNLRQLRAAAPRLAVVLTQIVSTDRESWKTMRDTMGIAAELHVRNVLFMAYTPISGHDLALGYFDDHAEMAAYLRAFEQEFGRRFDLMLPIPMERHPVRRFCMVAHTAPYVGPRGAISPCCAILPPSRSMGNAFDPDIWNQEFLYRFRREFSSHFPVHPRCRHCPTYAQGSAKGFFA